MHSGLMSESGQLQTNAPQKTAPLFDHQTSGKARRSPFPWNRRRDRLRPDQRGRSRMRRREFIAGLGSAAAWPVVVRAQQGDRVRRIGVLMLSDESDPAAKLRLSALTQALADLGWAD